MGAPLYNARNEIPKAKLQSEIASKHGKGALPIKGAYRQSDTQLDNPTLLHKIEKKMKIKNIGLRCLNHFVQHIFQCFRRLFRNSTAQIIFMSAGLIDSRHVACRVTAPFAPIHGSHLHLDQSFPLLQDAFVNPSQCLKRISSFLVQLHYFPYHQY